MSAAREGSWQRRVKRLLWYARGPIGWLVGLLLIIVVVAVMSDREVDQKCAALLGYARSTRDTLDAKIACEMMHSSNNESIAIGVAGGMAAGAIVGSAAR